MVLRWHQVRETEHNHRRQALRTHRVIETKCVFLRKK